MEDTLTLEEFHRYRDDPKPPDGDLEEPVELDPEPEPPPIAALETVKTCAVCGEPLGRGKKKFCSDSCDAEDKRQKKHDRRVRERAAYLALNGGSALDIPSVSDAPVMVAAANAAPNGTSSLVAAAPDAASAARFEPPSITTVIDELLEIPGIAIDMIVGGVQLSVRRA
jgi:predicted nucleic acid-binding Zn ribbon protein